MAQNVIDRGYSPRAIGHSYKFARGLERGLLLVGVAMNWLGTISVINRGYDANKMIEIRLQVALAH